MSAWQRIGVPKTTYTIHRPNKSDAGRVMFRVCISWAFKTDPSIKALEACIIWSWVYYISTTFSMWGKACVPDWVLVHVITTSNLSSCLNINQCKWAFLRSTDGFSRAIVKIMVQYSVFILTFFSFSFSDTYFFDSCKSVQFLIEANKSHFAIWTSYRNESWLRYWIRIDVAAMPLERQDSERPQRFTLSK